MGEWGEDENKLFVCGRERTLCLGDSEEAVCVLVECCKEQGLFVWSDFLLVAQQIYMH